MIDDDSGVGTQVVAGDINGDKKPDVVVGNKHGTFVIVQQPPQVSMARTDNQSRSERNNFHNS